MTVLHIDFETFSECDLKTKGLANYAADPSTGIHCMAFAFDDEDVRVLYFRNGHANDCSWEDVVEDHITAGGLVYAHNAPFELAIWNQVMVPRHGWPTLKPEQVRCTMAMCYAMGLPGALKDAAPALGIEQRKDTAGGRVMMMLATPKKDGSLWKYEDAPGKFEALFAYCKTDVEVERALHHRLLELTATERKVWTMDYAINQRGVLVDMPAVKKAIKLVQSERARLDKEILKVTGGVVGSCSEVALLVKWIASQGVKVPGLAKAAVLDALDGELPPVVRQALELRKEAAKSSTAKLQAMMDRSSADGRLRGIHQYYGAATGRWAGRGVQPQNLPRPRKDTGPEEVEDIIAHLNDPSYLDLMYGPVMDALADSIRGMLIPAPGHDFVAMDFSAIEARVIAWLAGEHHVLKTFRKGEDIYMAAAARIYHCYPSEVTKPQRQIGKVATLALGYGGGKGAFQAMAANYNVKVSDNEAEDIKLRWRENHPAIVQFWAHVEHAAIAAMKNGDEIGVMPSGVRFKKKGSFLWCRLPSRRVLCYPFPELRTVTTPWGQEKEALTYMTVVSNVKAKIIPDPGSAGSWQRISTYGGSLAENVTQAVARDLLAEAMLRLEAAGYPVVMHVHDEAVVEISSSCDNLTLPAIEAIMAEAPDWASGLPLKAEGWRARRYRKG